MSIVRLAREYHGAVIPRSVLHVQASKGSVASSFVAARSASLKLGLSMSASAFVALAAIEAAADSDDDELASASFSASASAARASGSPRLIRRAKACLKASTVRCVPSGPADASGFLDASWPS